MTRRRPARGRRLTLWAAALFLVATMLAGVFLYRPLVRRAVTWLALRDAAAAIGPDPSSYRARQEEILDRLAGSYGGWFRSGFLDRAYVIDRLPREGLTAEALPALAVAGGYFRAVGERWSDVGDRDDRKYESARADVAAEVLAWLRPVLASAGAKEALFHLLAGDPEVALSEGEERDVKAFVLQCLVPPPGKDFGFRYDDILAGDLRRRILEALEPGDWRGVIRDLTHPREGTRAVALLLLSQHPRHDLFLERAREAFGDPSAWVRMAAAGVLAGEGHAGAPGELVSGLRHERWEARWWCAMTLRMIDDPASNEAIVRQAVIEPDAWLRQRLREEVDLQRIIRSIEAEGLKGPR